MLEVDLGAQLLVTIEQAFGFVPLFARNRRQRGNHEQQAHVALVERRPGAASIQMLPTAAAECHQGRRDGVPAVDLDDQRGSLPRGALEKRRVDLERLDGPRRKHSRRIESRTRSSGAPESATRQAGTASMMRPAIAASNCASPRIELSAAAARSSVARSRLSREAAGTSPESSASSKPS